MTKNKIYISWKEFEEMAQQLAKNIKENNNNLKSIYGIPRGGLPLAVYLSHHLDLPLISNNEIDLETLIVDDISDNGDTLFEYNYCKTACLYSTPWTKVTPDFYLKLKESPNDWLVFPWEKKECETEKDNLTKL